MQEAIPIPDFDIQHGSALSRACAGKQIHTFHALCNYLRDLPYGRNPDKTDLSTVFTDQCGTCSTKHAIIKQVALEHGREDVELILGIFRMNGQNTPKVKHVLTAHSLDFIPEAHNYIKYRGQILDFTGEGFDPENYRHDILEETSILPGQITVFKVAYHRNYLDRWLIENPQISMHIEQLWLAREACIQALSGRS